MNERASNSFLLCKSIGIFPKCASGWKITRKINTRQWGSKSVPRDHDTLPVRLLEEPLPSGKAEECKAFISQEDFNSCLNKVYRLRDADEEGKILE